MFVEGRVDVAVCNDIIAYRVIQLEPFFSGKDADDLEIPYAEVIACCSFVTEEREF